jgi:hypothetical protein
VLQKYVTKKKEGTIFFQTSIVIHFNSILAEIDQGFFLYRQNAEAGREAIRLIYGTAI